MKLICIDVFSVVLRGTIGSTCREGDICLSPHTECVQQTCVCEANYRQSGLECRKSWKSMYVMCIFLRQNDDLRRMNMSFSNGALTISFSPMIKNGPLLKQVFR